MRSSAGNGSRKRNVSRWKAVTGPISTNVVWRQSARRSRRVTCQAAWECRRCAGWARRKRASSAQSRKRSRNPCGRSTSSSIDDEPVGLLELDTRQQRVEVLELPARARRRCVHGDLVTAAQQLLAGAGHHVLDLWSLDPDDHDAPRGRVALGHPVQAQAARGLKHVERDVGRPPQRAALAADRPALATQEPVVRRTARAVLMRENNAGLVFSRRASRRPRECAAMTGPMKQP